MWDSPKTCLFRPFHTSTLQVFEPLSRDDGFPTVGLLISSFDFPRRNINSSMEKLQVRSYFFRGALD